MSFAKYVSLALVGGSMLVAQEAKTGDPNQVAGTWRMISAELETADGSTPAYGTKPSGLLVFTEDLHYVEVLTDANVPKFASGVRGHGTPEENRLAMASSIGMFGTYTVDHDGQFVGDRVEGSTFPNWVGDVRTRKELQIVIDGDRLTEHFRRPDGGRINIIWQRVR